MEEEYYDVVDTYIATVKKAKTGKCEICQDTYEKEISEEALGDENRISLEDALNTINKFSVGVDVFWCQGPLFDYAILQDLYRQLERPVPWQYWQIRDSRTLFSLVPKQNDKRVGLHNALQDCIFSNTGLHGRV